MEAPKPVAPVDTRQRWRLVYARSAAAPHLAPRDQQAGWEAGLIASGLPVVGLELEPPRPRIAFAAPLGVGLVAERELADLFLSERRPVADVRLALTEHLPEGYRLVDLHDVWLGEPALPGQVVAADYRAAVRVTRAVTESAVADVNAVADVTAVAMMTNAARQLLEESTLPRTRDKGGRAVAYDLRPLLADIVVDGVAGPAPDPLAGPDGPVASEQDLIEIRIRVRYDPERGVGRPEEVVAALAELARLELSLESLVRERVLLAADEVAVPLPWTESLSSDSTPGDD